MVWDNVALQLTDGSVAQSSVEFLCALVEGGHAYEDIRGITENPFLRKSHQLSTNTFASPVLCNIDRLYIANKSPMHNKNNESHNLAIEDG